MVVETWQTTQFKNGATYSESIANSEGLFVGIYQTYASGWIFDVSRQGIGRYDHEPLRGGLLWHGWYDTVSGL